VDSAHQDRAVAYAGKNHGWPTCVAVCNNPSFVDPIKLFTSQTGRLPERCFITAVLFQAETAVLVRRFAGSMETRTRITCIS